MKRTWRAPILLLVPALIVAAAVVQRRHTETMSTPTRLDDIVATVAADDVSTSTWYCAAGTATGAADAYGEQSVVITNTRDDEATGIATAYSDTGTQAAKAVRVPAHGSTTVRTSDVLKAPWAAMVVEVSGGGIAVSQELRGTTGRAVAQCATEPSAAWTFPSGTTRAGARLTLAMFNPFPGEATVDVAFDTEDGARTPQQLQGMVVRGGHLSIVDVSAVVTLRERVSTTITVRSGRVIAQQVLSTDGRANTEAGLTTVPGSPAAASAWTFPVATPASISGKEIVAITNPGDSDVEVQVEVFLDDPARNGTVEPFVASVPARRSLTIDLNADPRIPKGVGHWIMVRTPGGERIVASRIIAAPKSGATGGLAASIGVPVVATRWFGTVPLPGETATALLAIVNPSATQQATVSLAVHTGGRVSDAQGVTSVTVAPGQRLVVDTAKLLGTRSDGPFEVTSDVPVVVAQWFTWSAPVDLSAMPAYPQFGTLSFPVDVFTSDQVEFVELPTRSDDTIVTTTTTTTSPDATTTTVAGATTSSTAATTTTRPAN